MPPLSRHRLLKLLLLFLILPGLLGAADRSASSENAAGDNTEYDEGYIADFALADEAEQTEPEPEKDPQKEYTRGRMAFLFGQYEVAYKIWEPLAEKGYDKAQATLGWMYHTGKGVEKDFSKARQWYRKAADQNNVIAQNNLGVFYEQGLGTGKSPRTAAKWYRESAEWGYSFAQYNLGMLYRQGLGVKQDQKEALFWLQIAALQGVEQAVAELEKISGQSHDNESNVAMAPQWKKAPPSEQTGGGHRNPHGSSGYADMAERIKRQRSQLNQSGYGGSLADIMNSPTHSAPATAASTAKQSDKPKAKPKPEVAKNSSSSDEPVPPVVTGKIPEDKFDKWLADAKVAQQRLKDAQKEKKTNSHSLKIYNDEWVSEQNPDFYTLQLARSDELDWLLNFAKKQPMLKNTAYFTEEKDGKKWYYLIYGNFKNRQSATNEINNLPKSLKKWSPWVRRFSELQTKMNASASQ
jgi:hypothetical protein